MSEKILAEDTPAVRERILFVWNQFGPYLVDRCEAVAAEEPTREVVGLEIANQSPHHYAWAFVEVVHGFVKKILFPGDSYRNTSWIRRTCGLVAQSVKINARYNFLCHYERFEIFILALVLRLFGRRVFVMSDSKFDDRPRSLWKEIPKFFFFLPYRGGLVSGQRAREYVMFLGMGGRPISEGYDTLSIKRVRDSVDPSIQIHFHDRRFVVVARLVAKKNLSLLIAAYDLYRKRVGESARELVIVGDGPLDQALKAEVLARKLTGITFTGFLQADGVARELSRGLALILPSVEEQWGLVINEALALGLPVMCSRNTGACDSLIHNGINGYIFEHDDIDNLVMHMELLTRNESHWQSMSAAAWHSAEAGDVVQFVKGVQALIKAVP